MNLKVIFEFEGKLYKINYTPIHNYYKIHDTLLSKPKVNDIIPYDEVIVQEIQSYPTTFQFDRFDKSLAITIQYLKNKNVLKIEDVQSGLVFIQELSFEISKIISISSDPEETEHKTYDWLI